MTQNRCVSQSECNLGEVCGSLGCEPAANCSDGSDCPLSHTCVDGSCEPTPESVASGCGAQADCASPLYCDLSLGLCVPCLIDEHCPLPETCLADGRCSGSDEAVDPGADGETSTGNPDEPDSESGQNETDEPGPDDGSQGAVEDCEATADIEEGPLCDDGLDNDCDGESDRFDPSCDAPDCGEPANYLTTDVCNSAFPEDHGPRVCETYDSPHSQAGERELCMDVCRTTADCPQGEACRVTRRSVNVHYCAPVLAGDLRAKGESCSADSQCETATCHGGFCREVCVRDADCGGDTVCRAAVLTPEYLGQEAASGLCMPRDPTLLSPGEPCSSASQCQNGACGQPYANGGYYCSKVCGSDYDCGVGQRCAGAMYSVDPILGHGLRTCSYQPSAAISQAGDYCSQANDCTTQICDGTYWHPTGQFLLAPFCNRYCDANSDCPILFPGNSAESYNLQMKCIVTSSGVIQPLVGGHCAPWWCHSSADCTPGRSCLIFNASNFDGMPPGICQ